MPRYLSLSNGRLLVNFDRQYHLRDLYWPHVGQENHTEGDPFRFGVFCDGQFSWVADPSWDKQIHPFTDEPLSACPLTWSHSTFVLAVHEYMTKCRELKCSASHLDDENADHPPAAPLRVGRWIRKH